MERKPIYLDHAATTYCTPEVISAMTPYFGEFFGNPNSQHGFGRETAKAVDKARRQVADAIGAKPVEIYFTASGSEADNWAIRGIASARREKGNHIITTAVEHPAVYTTCKLLEKEGFEVTYLPVDSNGLVSVSDLEKAIKDTTILISIMYANNEIGSIMPIKELAEVANRSKIPFHTDAVQAVGSVPIDVKDLGVTMLSLSAHKFYGPKGVGVLYIKSGTKIGRLISGGEQERSLRGGTTNVAGVVGLGQAIETAVRDLEKNNSHIKALRDRFVSEVLKRIPDVHLNGGMESRLPGNANFSFQYVEGESILFSLDLKGIAASSGSACSSSSLEPSRVLLSIGVPVGIAHGSIRFSFGKDNTESDVDYTVDTLDEIIKKLRAMSPLYKK